MNCCLCLYDPRDPLDGTPPEIVFYDGYSLCRQHAKDVIELAPYVRVWMDMRLHLRGTVEALTSPDFNQ